MGMLGNPNFAKWFGKSVVKDAAGEPLRVYHGTGANFDTFDASKTALSPRGSSGSLGFYFTANPKEASHYASGYRDSGAVVPAYLKIKNPIKIEQGTELWDQIISSRSSANAVKEKLMAAGYDGAITPLGEYVAFSPTQIKSAIGNRGTFDPTNSNILKGLIPLGLLGASVPGEAATWTPPTAESQALQEPTFDPTMLLGPARFGGGMMNMGIDALMRYFTGGK